MMRTKRGSILLTLGMLLPFVTQSGRLMAEATAPTISGYVDTMYGYSFNRPSNGLNSNTPTQTRAYDSQDNNIANTAHIAIGGSFNENTTYAVEFDAGSDARVTEGATTGSQVALQEAYVNYVSPSKIGFKAGKFVTYEGIEVIETNANPTISRGYLYTLAEPFTHVGGVLTYAVGKFDFAAGLVNGWDVPTDNNQGKTWVGKVGLTTDKLSATLSGYHGTERNQQTTNAIVNDVTSSMRDSVDLTVLTKIIPKVDLYLQANTGTEQTAADNDRDGTNDDRATWSGAGIQPVFHITDKFSLGGRLEYFDDKNGARVGYQVPFGGGSNTVADSICMTNFTITPGYQVNSNLLLRAEYRYDTANKKAWLDDKGVAKDSSNTVSVQAVVSF